MFKFKGVWSNEFSPALIVNKVQRAITPPITRLVSEIPGMDGAYPMGTKLGMRPIRCEITIVRSLIDNDEAFIRQLAGWLFSEQPEEFIDAKDSNVFYKAYLDNRTDLEEIVSLGKGILDFICPDPLIYQEEREEVFANGECFTLVEGTYRTFPSLRIEFSSPADGFKITHTQLDQYIRLNRSFVAGDVVEINCASGKVTLNGVVAMTIYVWEESDFFYLVPGAQTLLCEISEVAHVNIRWKPRWL